MGFYRKPKRETIIKNRQFYMDNYKQEIKWLNENVELFKGDKFLVDMYQMMFHTLKLGMEQLGQRLII